MSKNGKVPRIRWSRFEEKLLLNLINKEDDGMLKKVIVECNTNMRMKRFDAWERVT